MRVLVQSLDKAHSALQKSQGEGSRGGKVIGHTKSGKPIYDRFDHPGHVGFTKQDHHDAHAEHTKHYEEAKKEIDRKLQARESIDREDYERSSHHWTQGNKHRIVATKADPGPQSKSELWGEREKPIHGDYDDSSRGERIRAYRIYQNKYPRRK